MRHFIPATRSLMVLMALRATGVSPKRRRLAGVGLGRMAGRGAAAGKMAGMARVRRGGATACANSSAARRSALRKESGMFIELEVDGSFAVSLKRVAQPPSAVYFI